MFVELIEALRCPNAHEESPLIATAARTEARYIVEGTLGCPVCRAEFPIRQGETLLGAAPPAPDATPDQETAMRLAAFLELTDARGFAILCGGWGAHAGELARLSDTPVVLVNPPERPPDHVAGIVRTAGALPFAPQAARAAALEGASQALLASVTRIVRPGGRLVGPAALPLPAGASELVRDATMWVAEKAPSPDEPAARLVPLRRR